MKFNVSVNSINDYGVNDNLPVQDISPQSVILIENLNLLRENELMALTLLSSSFLFFLISSC